MPLLKTSAAGTNPIGNPAAFDVFKLDKLYSPFSRITSCNGRSRIFQEQQAPGFLGAFLVERGEHLVEVEYSVEIIAQAGPSGATFAQVQPLLAYCAALYKARPTRGARLTDLRLADMRIPQVALERLPYQQHLEGGKWGYVFKFREYKRLKIAGGVVKPPSATEQLIFVAQQGALQAQANANAAKAGARAAAAEKSKAGVGGFFK